MSDDRLPGRDAEAAELKADFDALRADLGTSGRIPDFHSMMERARREADGDEGVVALERPDAKGGSEDARRDLVRLGRWIPVAAAAAVAGLLFFGGGETGDDDDFERLVADYSASAAAWQSPTASLMDIPGVDLGAVPSFGAPLIDLDLAETTSEEGRDS